MSPRAVTILGYVLVALAVLALELAGRRRVLGVQPLGHVLGRLMRTRAGRIGLLAAWAWIGMHYFAL